MPRKWTEKKPEAPGHYRMRDRVFGWGPVEVRIYGIDGRLLCRLDGEGPCMCVHLQDIGHWVEWKEVE